MTNSDNMERDVLVHFVHGKESGPWGSKITRLADIARSYGLQVESLDYSDIMNPEARADRLIQSCHGITQRLVLAGSSMGGWVATRASVMLKPEGLFLMAPAFFLPGYAPVHPGCPGDAVDIVHGRNDDVIPYENSVRFAADFGCAVHLVNDDHRLHARHVELDAYFDGFLKRVLQGSAGLG